MEHPLQARASHEKGEMYCLTITTNNYCPLPRKTNFSLVYKEWTFQLKKSHSLNLLIKSFQEVYRFFCKNFDSVKFYSLSKILESILSIFYICICDATLLLPRLDHINLFMFTFKQYL